MTRLLLGLLLVVGIGCSGVQRVGPLAKMSGGKSMTADSKALPGQGAADPVTVPAVRPTPPTKFVDTDEVTPDNPRAAAYRLSSEIEADGKNIGAPPVTAEISRIKGRVK